MKEESLRKIAMLMKEDYKNNMDDFWDLMNDPDLEDKEPTQFEQEVNQLAKQCNLYEYISPDSTEATLEGEYLKVTLANGENDGVITVSGVDIDYESEDPAVWEQIRKKVDYIYNYASQTQTM